MDRKSPFDFYNLLAIQSYIIGLMNLDMNITQEDVQELEKEVNSRMEDALVEIHEHLAIQDEKLNRIIKELER